MTNCTNKWPTDEMVVRGAREVFDCLRQHDIELISLAGTGLEQYIAESVFLAMLDAAPEPPTVKDSITDEPGASAPVAWLITGPYEKAAFAYKETAEKYCAGLNMGYGEEAYKIMELYAAPQPAPDVSALEESL